MAALIDGVTLSPDQRVELYEDGIVWIVQTSMVSENSKPNQEIELDAAAATQLYDFLLLHMNRLHQAAKVIKYNREMDERNRIAYENRDKPWLPGYDE